MTATNQLMTAEELIMLPRGKMCYELVKGELIEMSPAGHKHGRIVVNLAAAPGVFSSKLTTSAPPTGRRPASSSPANPDTVRAPDVAFVSREQIERVGDPEGYWPGAPDLAVEILSPGDRVPAVEQKVEEYLEAGARLVWVVSQKLRNVTVYRSLTDIEVLTEKDTLDGEDVVPGFRLAVRELFV